MRGLADAMAAVLAGGQPGVFVRIEVARGSTPRDAGAAMLVTPEFTHGTVGGGQAEAMAMAAARAMLREGIAGRRMGIPLGPEIGQCCGGQLLLTMAVLTPALLDEIRAGEALATAREPLVMIYGAGHVGRALARALCLLPIRVKLVDSRAAEFGGLSAPGVVQVCTDAVVPEAENAPPGAAHVILTHSHALDSLLAVSLLERGDFAWLGIIGSHTKRVTFERAFREIGIAEAAIARIVCPIGGSAVRDKRPEIIAALTAAELVEVFAGIS